MSVKGRQRTTTRYHVKVTRCPKQVLFSRALSMTRKKPRVIRPRQPVINLKGVGVLGMMRDPGKFLLRGI